MHPSQNYVIKEEVDKYPDLSYTSLNQIRAKDITDGMWCIHSRSGFTGMVVKYHIVKSGKHGHTKCIYELKYPHNNKTAKESCSGKTIIQQAIVQYKDYLVSHIDKQTIAPKNLFNLKQQA
eukprot:800609_1